MQTALVLILLTAFFGAPGVADDAQQRPAAVASVPSRAQAALDEALSSAISRRGGVAKARVALDRGANPNARVGPRQMPLLFYAVLVENLPLIRLLLSRGANPRVTWNRGVTVLILAANTGNSDVLRLMLAQKVDVNAQDADGLSALDEAATIGLVAPVRLLLDRGAKVNTPGDRRTSALLCAIGGGDPEDRLPQATPFAVAKLLLSRGADVNAVAQSGTPLIAAAAAGDLPMMQMLVDRGAKINIQEPVYGLTALIAAATNGRVAAVRYLLAHGADPAPRSRLLGTALHAAEDQKSAPIIALLKGAGAK